jgi:hypothetical protein
LNVLISGLKGTRSFSSRHISTRRWRNKTKWALKFFYAAKMESAVFWDVKTWPVVESYGFVSCIL